MRSLIVAPLITYLGTRRSGRRFDKSGVTMNNYRFDPSVCHASHRPHRRSHLVGPDPTQLVIP